MAEAKKFLFDTYFDPPEQGLDLGQPDPEDTDLPPEPTAAERDPEPSHPTFGEEDLSAARAAAFEEGQARGREEAMDSIDQAVRVAMEAMTARLDDIHRDLDAQEDARHREGLRLSASIIRKLFPRLAEERGLSEIERTVEQCLIRMREEPRLVIRAAGPLIDVLRERCEATARDTSFEGKFVFIPEDDLGPSDVLVEWADGGAERSLERQWRDIEELLSHSLEEIGDGATTNDADTQLVGPEPAKAEPVIPTDTIKVLDSPSEPTFSQQAKE